MIVLIPRFILYLITIRSQMQFHAATERLSEDRLSAKYQWAWDSATNRCASGGSYVGWRVMELALM